MMNESMDHFESLLNKLMAGTASTKEKETLQRLIDSDEHKEKVYRICTEGQAPDDIHTAAAFERHRDAMREQGYLSEQPLPTHRTNMRGLWWRIGAAAMVLFFIGLFVWKTNAPHAGTEFVTGNGERKKLELPDGSVVWLNSGSKLVYETGFNVHDRKVTFQGEGYFDISKDTERPFIIDAGEATIRVLGTVFNLRAYTEEAQVETTLIEGRVELTTASAPTAPVLLEAGKKLAVYKRSSPMPLITSELTPLKLQGKELALVSEIKINDGETQANDVLWKDGKLVFDGDKLDRIASKLEKWYGVEVSIADTAMHNLAFSGVFQNMELDAVLETLAQTGTLHYTRVKNEVTFTLAE